MNQVETTNHLIDQFGLNILNASKLLYDAKLYSHLLVIIYSSIDSLGLLDAPSSQITATGISFKSWSQKYLLKKGIFEFNEVDLWAARCSVLHTFTSQSDLSRAGTAKELQYFSGPKESKKAKSFIVATKLIEGGTHLPVNIDEMYLEFLFSTQIFLEDLKNSCAADSAYEKRLRNVIQQNIL